MLQLGGYTVYFLAPSFTILLRGFTESIHTNPSSACRPQRCICGSIHIYIYIKENMYNYLFSQSHRQVHVYITPPTVTVSVFSIVIGLSAFTKLWINVVSVT